MQEPLEEAYFRWLYGQVANVKLKNPSRTYWSLLKQFHTREFVWIIPNDDNRLEDGRYLRYEFVNECGLDVDPEWVHLGCSMLELLIGLARRLYFEDDAPVDIWFWRLMENLGLSEFTDKSRYTEQDVDDVIDDVIWRTYDKNGHGGLFPLRHAHRNQQEVELWYQMSEYLLENGG
jgi:hypothetical protein